MDRKLHLQHNWELQTPAIIKMKDLKWITQRKERPPNVIFHHGCIFLKIREQGGWKVKDKS